MNMSTVLIQSPKSLLTATVEKLLTLAGTRPIDLAVLPLGYQKLTVVRCRHAGGLDPALANRIGAATNASAVVVPSVPARTDLDERVVFRGEAADSAGFTARLLAGIRDAGGFPADVNAYRIKPDRILVTVGADIPRGGVRRLSAALGSWVARDGAKLFTATDLVPLVLGSTRPSPSPVPAATADVVGRKVLTVSGTDPAETALRVARFLDRHGARVEREHGQTSGGLYVFSTVFTLAGVEPMLRLVGQATAELVGLNPLLGPTHWSEPTADGGGVDAGVQLNDADGPDAPALVVLAEAIARTGGVLREVSVRNVPGAGPGGGKVRAEVKFPTAASLDAFRSQLQQLRGPGAWELNVGRQGFAGDAALIFPQPLIRSRPGDGPVLPE